MKLSKIMLIIAGCLIFVGSIVFILVMSINNWDFSSIGGSKMEIKNYEIKDNITDIVIKTTTSDIRFVNSPDSIIKVECAEHQNVSYMVKTENNTLRIELVDNRKWYNYLNFNLKKEEIKVYLPINNYNNLNIESSTGNVEIPNYYKFNNVMIKLTTGNINYSCNTLDKITMESTTGNVILSNNSGNKADIKTTTGSIKINDFNIQELITKVSTGNVYLTNISCINLSSYGTTGNITLNKVITSETLTIERSTGNVKIEKCDGGNIYITTSTGNVTGSLLSEKIFVTNTKTGKVEVPKSITGSLCEISTSTGNIKITFEHN